MTRALFAALALAAAPLAAHQVDEGQDLAPRAERTVIKDPAAANRLRANTGVTLQWIGWDKRGKMRVAPGTLWRLSGGQAAGAANLLVDGVVAEIGRDYFTFDGRITIADTPDLGRRCERDGRYTFEVTGKRRYWRLQEMEVCDGLTDYVDIYF